MTNQTLAQLKARYDQLETEYRRERANLEKQIAETKKLEQATAVAQIRSIMNEFGIEPGDLSSAKKSSKTKKMGTVAVKYRGANGETWTGRGRQPKWIGDDREKYLIKD
jgi:DNA-binding protein H-NS